MNKKTQRLNQTMIAVYHGDDPIFVGEFQEAIEKLKISRGMLKYYLTPSGQKRSLQSKIKALYVMRVET